jgi:hypothetical protein
MNMPKDTKGAAPEDVEAHMPVRKRDAQGEEPGRARDTDDVEAHMPVRKRDAQGEEPARLRDTSEDVEAHSNQRPRPEDGGGDDVEAHRLSR